MKNAFSLLLFLVISTATSAQSQNPNYDSTLSVKLGSDDYGMKRYTLVILKTGSNKRDDKAFVDSCFQGHMNNIEKMVSDGKLVVAGPLMKNDMSYRGIFILNTTDREEVDILLNRDPAIRERLLEPEIFGWYGSAALPIYLEDADKVWKVRH